MPVAVLQPLAFIGKGAGGSTEGCPSEYLMTAILPKKTWKLTQTHSKTYLLCVVCFHTVLNGNTAGVIDCVENCQIRNPELIVAVNNLLFWTQRSVSKLYQGETQRGKEGKLTTGRQSDPRNKA